MTDRILDEWVELFRSGPTPENPDTQALADQAQAFVAEVAAAAGVDMDNPEVWAGAVFGLTIPLLLSRTFQPSVDADHPEFLRVQIECAGLAQHVVLRRDPVYLHECECCRLPNAIKRPGLGYLCPLCVVHWSWWMADGRGGPDIPAGAAMDARMAADHLAVRLATGAPTEETEPERTHPA